MSKTSPAGRKYGWVRDTPDFRDKVIEIAVTAEAVLPPSVNLEAQFPQPPYDQGDLGSCHDNQTEVLTEHGWKLFSELQNVDKLATVNPLNGHMIFEIPTRLVRFHYDGNIYHGIHQNLDFCVTPDHQMLVRKWNEAKRTLNSTYEFVKSSDLGWYSGLLTNILSQGENFAESYVLHGVDHKHKPQRESIEIPMSTWLKFLGVYLAEGTILQQEYKIQIAASKDREKNYVRTILSEIGVKALELNDRFTFENKRIYRAMESLGLKGVKAPNKFVPDFVFALPGKLMCHLLEGHFMGDGCQQNDCISHYTSSKRLADDLQRLYIMSGEWANIYTRDRTNKPSKLTNGRKIVAKYPEYRVGVWSGKGALSIDNKANMTIEHYNGEVFCAEVPTYHTLITRRNGKVLISGNCTANAIAAAVAFDQAKQKQTLFMPSRLFVYYNERAIEGSIGSDSGAQIRDGFKTLATQGVCTEVIWPYDITKFTRKPVVAAYKDALKHKAVAYKSVPHDLVSLKTVLSSGFPIVFGISVYDSFESESVARTGDVPMPQNTEECLGGHAIVCVGYDDATQRFTFRNSWGTSWGKGGYGTLPYAYLTSNNLASDFWVVEVVTKSG